MKICKKEKEHCLKEVKNYNKRCVKYGLNDYLIDERRCDFGYDCINEIIFEMCNFFDSLSSYELKNKVFDPLYENVMNWQNGWLPFQKKGA